MLHLFRGLTVCVLMLLSMPAVAADCPLIRPATELKFDIKPGNGYFNCVAFDRGATLDSFSVIADSLGKLPFVIQAFRRESNGSLTPLSASDSTDGVAGLALKQRSGDIVLSIKPTDGSKTATRVVSIFYMRDRNDGVVIANIENDTVAAHEVNVHRRPKAQYPALAAIPGRQCSGRMEGCVEPLRSAPSRIIALAAPTTHVATPACTAANTPPPQNQRGPKRFDLNSALKQAAMVKMASLLTPRPVLVRAAWISQRFAPGQPWDLKSNPEYLSDQAYGNFVYGAVAAELGFSLDQTLKAGALVQQYQNYKNPKLPQAGDRDALARGLAIAILTGKGDNPDDPPVITAGFRYDTDIYRQDPYKNIVTNSCDKTTADDTVVGGSGLSEVHAGWGVDVLWVGGSGCIGSCGRQGSVTVIPRQPRRIKEMQDDMQ